MKLKSVQFSHNLMNSFVGDSEPRFANSLHCDGIKLWFGLYEEWIVMLGVPIL